MNKYLLFMGDTYYPDGGAKDYIDSFDSIYDAIKYLYNLKPSIIDKWCNVLNIKTGLVVLEGKYQIPSNTNYGVWEFTKGKSVYKSYNKYPYLEFKINYRCTNTYYYYKGTKLDTPHTETVDISYLKRYHIKHDLGVYDIDSINNDKVNYMVNSFALEYQSNILTKHGEKYDSIEIIDIENVTPYKSFTN